MSIADYSGLVAAVANWLNRSDLTARIPDFITLAEARMNTDHRLRVRDSVATITYELDSQRVSLNNDILEILNIELVGTSPLVTLEASSLQTLDNIRAQTPTGTPKAYALVGSVIELAPVPTDFVEADIIYRRKVPPITLVDSTNWLLTAAPNVYLAAILVEAYGYLFDTEATAAWDARYNQAVERYKEASDIAEAGSSPLKMRARNFG